jgi:hypothetical protein
MSYVNRGVGFIPPSVESKFEFKSFYEINDKMENFAEDDEDEDNQKKSRRSFNEIFKENYSKHFIYNYDDFSSDDESESEIGIDCIFCSECEVDGESNAEGEDDGKGNLEGNVEGDVENDGNCLEYINNKSNRSHYQQNSSVCIADDCKDFFQKTKRSRCRGHNRRANRGYGSCNKKVKRVKKKKDGDKNKEQTWKRIDREVEKRGLFCCGIQLCGNIECVKLIEDIKNEELFRYCSVYCSKSCAYRAHNLSKTKAKLFS